jgi:hypothetical protein
MPPASSAVPGAWPIVGRARRASCPPSAALTPQAPPGGVRAAEESGCGEYATFRVLWGLKGERKGRPAAPSMRPGGRPASCRPKCEFFLFKCKCRPRCARPSRRSLAAAPGQHRTARPPARWRVGSAHGHRPTRHRARGKASIVLASWPARRPPVGSRGPPPPSAYHARLIQHIRALHSYVVFQQRTGVFLGKIAVLSGFSACAAMVYFGTMAVPGRAVRPGKKSGRTSVVTTRTAGSASCVGAHEPWPV